MNTIPIFIASSITELHVDRLELGNFVRQVDDVSVARDIYLRLFNCEDESLAMEPGRKQESYNQQIRESRLCVVLMYNHAGDYTIEEFNTAMEQFGKTGAPKVLVCFRRGAGHAPDESLADFNTRLDREKIPYSVYEDIDEVKYRLLVELAPITPELSIDLTGDTATVDGVPILRDIGRLRPKD